MKQNCARSLCAMARRQRLKFNSSPARMSPTITCCLSNLFAEYNLFVIIPLLLAIAAPQWTLQTSGVTARLRGVSVVSGRVAWASGSGSTVLRTDDAGATWKKMTVTSDALDFRDIDAIDEQTAYVLSIGNGAASRIYKTVDGGTSWTLQFRNEDRQGF